VPLVSHMLHMAPLVPHAAWALPIWQCAPSQQPLHCPLPVQSGVHWFATHPKPGAQSVGTLQPQTFVLRQTAPTEGEHAVQAVPEPHAVAPLSTHSCADVQHEPAPHALASQSAEHEPPMQLAVGSLHWEHCPPPVPQAVATVPPPHIELVGSQHPPWQGDEALQVAVHVPVATSQARPTGHSLALEHPASIELSLPVSLPTPRSLRASMGPPPPPSILESPDVVASVHPGPVQEPSASRPQAATSSAATILKAKTPTHAKIRRPPNGPRISLILP
jgi:hypothetical protein